MNLIIIFEKDYISENRVRLSDRRLDHVLSFLKPQAGDKLKVGRLNGKKGYGLVKTLTPDCIEMEIDLSEEPPPPLDVTLVLAMPRPKAFKRILQHVTAMGVKDIYMIKTWRVEKSFWDSPALLEENLFQEMLLGLEQAGDTIMPEIHIRKLFRPFVEDELPDVVKGTMALAAHPVAEDECPRNPGLPVTLAIGPDGGFIPFEIGMLRKAGFEIVSIGQRILRVETAVTSILGRLF